MKQACRKFSTFLFAVALIVPASLLAQEGKEKDKETKEKREAEQIIITRKGDKKDKMVIEVDGDKITVNGKEVSNSKDAEISVRRNKIRDVWAYADGLNGFSSNGNGFGHNIITDVFTRVDTNRAMLGVTPVSTGGYGAKITSVTKGSAAEKAGLKEGDVVVKIGDTKIETADDLSVTVRKYKVGDKVAITYERDKKEQTTTAEMGKWKGASVTTGINTDINKSFNFDMGELDNLATLAPRIQGQAWNGRGFISATPKLGLSVQDTDDGKGVKVLEVDHESNADKAGLKEGDIITDVDGKAVNSADEVAKIIRESKEKISVMMKLQRSGKSQNIEVKIPRKLKTANM